ncbi:MAG TPA: hypothetical protein VIZ00_12755 [Streptosporangiaceae bacterium]
MARAAVRMVIIVAAMKMRPSVMAAWVTWLVMAQVTIEAANQWAAP